MWIVYTLVNIVSIGIFSFLFKTQLKRTGMSQAWLLALGSAVATLLFVFLGIGTGSFTNVADVSFVGVLWLSASILVNVFGLVSYLTAIRKGELSVIGPLENLRPFFVALFAFFIFKEILMPIQTIGMFLIIIGAIILITETLHSLKKIFSGPGVLLMLFSATCYGFTSIADSFALRQTGFPVYVYATLLTLGVTIVYMMLALVSTKGTRLNLTKSGAIFSILTGALAFAGTLGILTALSTQSAQVVIPLQMTRSLFVASLGFLFLKEKGVKRKVSAGFIMIVGVYFILQ